MPEAGYGPLVAKFDHPHPIAGLPPQRVHVEIDYATKLVTVQVPVIDSALICDLVIEELVHQFAVVAYVRYPAASLSNAIANEEAYRLRLKWEGTFFGAIVCLVEGRPSFLRMEPSELEFQRMARDSCERVLRALHHAGYEAIVAGLRNDGTLDDFERALNIFVRPDAVTHDRPSAHALVKQYATVNMYVMSDYVNGIEAFEEPHLAWDPCTRRCVEVRSAPSRVVARKAKRVSRKAKT
jgi:hypothetical protein